MSLISKIKKFLTSKKKTNKKIKPIKTSKPKHEDYELEERRHAYNPYREF